MDKKWGGVETRIGGNKIIGRRNQQNEKIIGETSNKLGRKARRRNKSMIGGKRFGVET